MRASRAGLTAIAVALLASGCAAGSDELRRENEDLRRMVMSQRTDLEDMRRDQERLRAQVETLQHAGGNVSGSAAVASSIPSETASPAVEGETVPPSQRWPADPWASADPFGASGTPHDLDTLQPGEGVSPTGAPVPTPSLGAPAAPSPGVGSQAGPMPQPFMNTQPPPLAAPPIPTGPSAAEQAAPSSEAALAAAKAAPPISGAPSTGPPPIAPAAAAPSPGLATERPPGSDIVASVRSSGTGTEPTKASIPDIPAPSVPDSLTGTLYDQGVKAFNEGRYDDAIQNFRDYVHQQPQSAYADDAQFLIGESNLRKGQYNNAIKEFNQVVLRYASGDRSAASLLKLAEVFSKMNDQVDARLSLQKLVNRYPGSAEAAQAYKMLQEMGG